MKFNFKKAAALFLAALTLSGVSAGASTAFADGTDDSSSSGSTHTLNSSYVVYGAGTSSEVRSRLDDVFQSDSSFKKLTATAADYSKYISQQDNTTDAAMISSVAIAPGDPGSGVKVNIKNYDGENNITKVTSQQYACLLYTSDAADE